MKTIQKWFNDDCPYKEGVKLYASLPRHNKNIARLLSRAETKTNLFKLKYELKQLAPEPIKIEAKPVVLVSKKGISYKVKSSPLPKAVKASPTLTTIEKPKKQEKKSLYFHDLPDELRPVLLEANQLFKELCLLKVQLNEQPKKAIEACNAIQVQMHAKRQRNTLCWQKIDYYLQHRELPPVTVSKFKDLTPAQLWKKDQYAFQNISKNKKRLEANKIALETATTVTETTRIQRKIAKNEANILRYTEQQIELKALIDGKD